jgi:hypothetical protein
MAWLGDTTNRLSEEKVELLKAQRAALVEDAQKLGRITSFPTPWAKRFHEEDLTEIAKKIGAIDRKLGRTQ